MRQEPEVRTGRTSIVRILLSTLILAVGGVAGYIALHGPPDGEIAPQADPTATLERDSAAPLQAPPALAVPVETAIAARRDLVMRITATGTAEATRQLDVETAVGGTIVDLPTSEGQVVAAGDLLAALDDTELRLKVQMQREALVRSMAKFAEKQAFLSGSDSSSETTREMVAAQEEVIGGVMSPQQFRSLIDDPRFNRLFETITRDEVMASQDGLLTDRANFAMAEIQLERAQTRAPFKGQIAAVDAVVGQRVAPGAKLLTLVDADPIRVRVAVIESEAGLVRVGRRAAVIFAAFPSKTLVGEVEAINPLVDPDAKTLEVIVNLPNPDLLLRPGMFAQITLDTEIFNDRLLVPATAVLLRDDRSMLFVVRDGRSQWVYIRKGLENNDWVEVLEGIEPGDEVVTSGHYSLAHDAAVRVVRPDDAETSPTQ